MSWIARLALRSDLRTGARVVCGQLRWAAPQSRQIRGAVAESGAVLFPNPDGTFGVAELRGVRVDRRTIPDADAMRCLRVVGDGIRRRVGEPWLEWLEESPLMPVVDKTLEETELEQETRARIGWVESVCRRPRTHLKYEEERQLVARCKRPSTRAAMVLATRSEDWDRRTLWGVRPRRILGLVREDLYDLYENRLTVALIDRIDEALLERVREVRRVVRQARSVANWQSVVASSRSYRRASRVCTLWGELWKDEGLLARAERALTRLLSLRRRVLALKDSDLYRRIGGRTHAIALRMTNLLTHDESYREVVSLWEAWVRHARAGQVSPQARWDQEQLSHKGMQLLSVLLVVRALEILGFAPSDDVLERPLTPGSVLELHGPLRGISLEWELDGALTLRHDCAGPLSIVALPAMLESASTTVEWITSLESRNALILFLESDSLARSRELAQRLRGPGPVDSELLFIPVAPWQLESVERVARALRWRLWSSAMKRYPRTVSLPHPAWTVSQRPEFVRDRPDIREIQIVAPSDCQEWPELDERIRGHELERERLRSRLGVLDRRRQRDKNHLRKQLADVDNALRHDGMIREQVFDQAEQLSELLQCPVCHFRNARYVFETADDQYRVTCHACQTTWGLRQCSHCQSMIPYLDCPDNEPGADALEIDAHYGCDVLAFPLERDVYSCTSCGQPSSSKRSSKKSRA